MVARRPRTAPRLENGFQALAEADPDFAGVLAAHGAPPPRRRPAGFETLLKIMMQQQVSLASADAIWGRLTAAVQPLQPARLMCFDEAALRALGLSRQKALYARDLSQAILDRRLDLDGLAALEDEAAIEALTAVRGIGRWTAEIYLLAALQRPDVFPAADLALMAALQDLKRLSARPNRTEMLLHAEAWRPWRASAARLLWHYCRVSRGRAVAPS